ncbi:hypothetical protein ACBJ59_62270 [Nonomuraea sp. MTCD27]|uniref:hypothetical protein n=1 Tax=Nonomuraea sp. MTCD27 TaxID=1676747 RepID=UPI0035BFC9FD
MDDSCQPGTLPPSRPPDSITPARDTTTGHDAKAWPSCDQLTTEKVTATRHACYTAAAKAIFALQNGQRLTGEQLFVTVHAQAARAWWDLVEEEITSKQLTSDHALRRVRSWARHYLTAEPPAARPGTLFDHALAHAARMATRDFLGDSGHLLAQHLIHQAAHPAGTSATATPAEHDHPRPVGPTPPAPTAVAP